MHANADIRDGIKTGLNLLDEFRMDHSTLEFSKEGPDTWACPCPFHSENTASCKVHPGDGFFKCFGCGKAGDIFNYIGFIIGRDPKNSADFVEILREGAKRAGIEFVESNMAPSREPEKPKTVYPTIEKLKAFADYCAGARNEKRVSWDESVNPETGAVEIIEIRFDHLTKVRSNGKPVKSFWQCSAVQGGFIASLDKTKPIPLFNRTRILDESFIVLVEGVKCAKFLQSLGICAAAIPGGSNAKVENVDWTPLAGKTVVIWPDNDSAGVKFAAAVQAILEPVCALVSTVDISELNLAPKDDVVDFWEKFEGDKPEKLAAVNRVLTTSQPETIASQIAAEINGTRYAIRHAAFMALSSTLCFLPGSLTLLCANPGVSKSWLVVQWIWQMFQDEIDTALLCLESGETFHGRRIMAQMAGRNDFLNPEWVLRNPEEAVRIMDTFQPFVDRMAKAKVLQAPKMNQETNVDYLLAWIESMAKLGKKFVAIDPITSMETKENFWNDQQNFVRRVKALLLKTGIRLLLVTHPRKGAECPHMDNLSGAAAFSRNADTILWLVDHDDIVVDISNPGTMQSEKRRYNRTMKLLKTRLGPAAKRDIGYYVDWVRLIHDEIGFVESQAKE